VVEGLVRLDKVRGPRFFFVGLPLPLAGLDGSPIRALAILGPPEDL
jgi:kynurenine formamidase